jgi:hypothetical protein
MSGPGGRNGNSTERRQRAEVEQLKLALAEATAAGSGGWGLSMCARSLRRPRGPKSGGGNAGFEVRCTGRYPGTHVSASAGSAAGRGCRQGAVAGASGRRDRSVGREVCR